MAKGKGAGAGVCSAACPGPFIAGPFPTFTAAPARAGTKTPATSSAPGLIVLLFIVVSSTFSFSCCAAPSRTPARKYARTHALTSPLLFPPLYLSLRPPLSPLSPLLTPLAHPHVLGHHTHTHTHTHLYRHPHVPATATATATASQLHTCSTVCFFSCLPGRPHSTTGAQRTLRTAPQTAFLPCCLVLLDSAVIAHTLSRQHTQRWSTEAPLPLQRSPQTLQT